MGDQHPAEGELDIFDTWLINLSFHSAESLDYQRTLHTERNILKKVIAFVGYAYSAYKIDEDLDALRGMMADLRKRKNQEAYHTLYGRDPVERLAELETRVGYLL